MTTYPQFKFGDKTGGRKEERRDGKVRREMRGERM